MRELEDIRRDGFSTEDPNRILEIVDELEGMHGPRALDRTILQHDQYLLRLSLVHRYQIMQAESEI